MVGPLLKTGEELNGHTCKPKLLYSSSFMAQAVSLHALAARLWLLSTLSCPAPSMLYSIIFRRVLHVFSVYCIHSGKFK